MKLKNILKAGLIVFIIYVVFATIFVLIELDNIPKYNSIDLLAVSKNEQQGAIASMDLEIHPGHGRLYIDSFPLTRADTQVATRFAKETACDILDKDCSRMDFFYQLRSESALVGGTSAGAATTLLTIAALENMQLRNDVAITGTINSGGLVGPVGGIREKIIAAANNGFTKVLIPKWNNLEPEINASSNESIMVTEPIIENATDINLTDVTEDEITHLEDAYNIEVIRISNIFEALEHFLQEDTDISQYYTQENAAIQLSDTYMTVMQDVAGLLCKRYVNLNSSLPTDENEDLRNQSENFYSSAINASARYKYYSTASYCFSANLQAQQAISRNFTQEEKKQRLNELYIKLSTFEEELENRSINTVTDLEAHIITHQRIQETYHMIDEIDSLNISGKELAYAIERFISAKVWSVFYDRGDMSIKFDNNALEQTCESKLGEASERINYLTVLLRFDHDSAQEQLKDAYTDYYAQRHALCIFKATKAKAEADAVINSMFIREHNMQDLLDEREHHIARIIAKEQSRGIFPLLGYSYYEYASDLKKDKPATALLYQEYAMEFSKLSTYLHKKKGFSFISLPVKVDYLFVLTAGIIIGLLLSMFLEQRTKTTKNNKPGKPSTKRQSPRKKR